MFYVYVLLSKKDGKLYVGVSKKLKLKFEQHIEGLVESAKNRNTLKLIYYEGCLIQQDAARRGKYLKTHYGKLFLKNRLKSYFAV